MTNQTANRIPLATIKSDTPDETRMPLTYDAEAKVLYAELPGGPAEEVGPRFETVDDAKDYIDYIFWGSEGAWYLEWIGRDEA